MRLALTALLVGAMLSLGCAKAVDTASAPATGGSATGETSDASGESSAADGAEASADGFKFGPENAQIIFVGTHVGEPNPRTGHFEKFAGVATLSADGKSVEAIEVEIAADSLWTPIDKLTGHLNHSDFLDTREFPTATFKTTQIEPGSTDGEVTITGDLTLHGVTKEISFPATVKVTDGAVELKASHVLKRTEFGMDKNLEGVVDEVDLVIVIGEKTERPAEQPAQG